jgi:hypothetical protein
MEQAYNMLDNLLPNHVLRLEFDNIIRFSNTKAAYLNRFQIVKYMKRYKQKSKKTRSKKNELSSK